MAGDDLLVGVGIDLGGLARDAQRATAFFQRFQKDVDRIITRTQFGGNFSEKGRKAAANLLGGLESEFKASTGNLKETLARGLISNAQFRVIGLGAAEEFNRALGEGIDRLEAQNLLPQGLRQELQAAFKDVGEGSGKAMADAIGERLESIGNRISGVGKGLSVGITAPLVALATGAVAASETIDAALDTIRIGTGKTGAALQGLQSDFDAVFTALPVSAQDAATAVTLLSQRTGATGTALRTLAIDVLNLSRLTKTDLNTNIEKSQRLFQNFGIAASDQGEALNFLFRTTQATGANFDELATSMTKFGPVLRQLGFSFEESAALLGQFEKQGVDLDQTLSRMQIALAKFAAKGIAAPQALESLISQIKRAGSETKAINIAANLFGARGAAGFAAAVREGRISFDDLLSTIRRSPETIAAAARDTDGFKEALQQLRNEVTRALAPLGVELVGALREMLPQIISTARAVGSLARSFANLSPATQKFVLATAAFGASVGPLLIGIGGMVSGFGRLVPLMFSAATAARTLAGAAGLASLATLLVPGGIILVGLGLIAAAIYKSGQAARESARDLDAYKTALGTLGAGALPDLTKSVSGLEAQVKFLRAQRAEILKTETAITRFTDRSDLGTGEREVKNPKIANIDAQLAGLVPRLEAAKSRFNALLDAELATETGAHKVAKAIAGITAPGVLDIDFGTEKASKALNALESNVRELLGAYADLQKQGRTMPGIVEALVKAHDKVTVALKAQGDQYSTHGLKLADLKHQLEDIDAIIVETARRKFGGIEGIPQVPRLSTTAQIVEFETTDTSIIPVMKLRGDLVDIRIPTNVQALVQKQLSFKALPALPLDIDPTFDPAKLSLGLKNAFADLRIAKADIGIATLLGDRDALAKATDKAADATKRLQVETKKIADVIRGSSDLTPAQKAFGLEVLSTQLQAAQTDAENFADAIRSITQGARGLLSVGDAFGAIGEQARDAIGAVVDLVDATATLVALTAQGGKTLGKIGAALGAAGGLVGVIDALISNPEGKANREILRQNNQVLERLRQDLAGFSNAIIGQSLTAADAIKNSSILQQRALTSGFSRGFKNVEALDEELRAAGTSLAELKRRAEFLGISIVDAKGRITAEGLIALEEATRLAIQSLLTFKNTLEDQQFIAESRRDILDLTEPQAALDDWVDLIQKFAPEIFNQFFKGIDVSTKAGQAQFEQGIRDVFDLAAAGKIPEEFLKAFGGIKGFVEFLLDADNALDGLADTADDLNSEMVNVVQGFRDFNLDRAKFQAQQAKIVTEAPGAPLPTTPDVEAFAKVITGKLPSLATGDIDKFADAIRDAGAAAEITRLSDTILTLADSIRGMPAPVVTVEPPSTAPLDALAAELVTFTSALTTRATGDLDAIAQAIRDAAPTTEIARLQESILALSTVIKATEEAKPAPVIPPVVVPVPEIPKVTEPAPAPPPSNITTLTFTGDFIFTQPVKDAAQMVDEFKIELTRRARASSNPEVKRVVSLLP